MIKVESACPHCSRTNKFDFAGPSGTMRKLKCSNCKKSWEETFEEDFNRGLEKSARGSEVIGILDNSHDLQKKVQGDLEVATKIAEFSMAEMRKWEPAVKKQVSDWAKAAIPRFKEAFGETDSALFIKSVDGMLAAMNDTSDKADPTSLIKQIQSGRSGERFGPEGIFGMQKASSSDATPMDAATKSVAEARRQPISGRDFLFGS